MNYLSRLSSLDVQLWFLKDSAAALKWLFNEMEKHIKAHVANIEGKLKNVPSPRA